MRITHTQCVTRSFRHHIMDLIMRSLSCLAVDLSGGQLRPSPSKYLEINDSDASERKQ